MQTGSEKKQKYEGGNTNIEMCYDATLVMPSSYAVMEEEEMTYVEGGWCIENKLWGYNIFLTHK